MSKELLADTIRSLAKFSDHFGDLKHATGLDIKKILTKHHRGNKALDKGWVVESTFWLGQVVESGELRMQGSALKLIPSATVHFTLAEAAGKFRALCASGLFQFVGVQVESPTQWVEVLVSGRAPPFSTYNRTHIPRFSCFVRVDATDKLTNQVEESFTGREGLTKLHSMVPLYMMKKIELVSLELFAMYSWLMTAEQSKLIEQSRWQSLSIFQICRSYQWSVLAAVVQLASLRRKTTDPANARSSVDALIDWRSRVHWNARESHFLVERRVGDEQESVGICM